MCVVSLDSAHFIPIFGSLPSTRLYKIGNDLEKQCKYAEHNFYANKAIAKLWTWLFTIDALIYSILRVKIPVKLGYYVLCDRYIPDIIVDLMCETRNNGFLKACPVRYFWYSSKNSQLFS